MRLGYVQFKSDDDCSLVGFNEAEAHAPRIQAHRNATISPSLGFNEAEAHAPRILNPIAHIRIISVSFNEAEAHAPRILRTAKRKALRWHLLQ